MILLVRHCSALGQQPEAELSEIGKNQSEHLAVQLVTFFNVTRIISSPFKRAFESVKPLAEHLNLVVESNELLRERFFQNIEVDDCTGSEELHYKLKHSFENLDYKACEEGESNTECQGRANKFLLNLQKSDGATVIVSHGNFIAALLNLNAENRVFGYEEMCSLSNPDVFILNYDYDSKLLLSFNRIWNDSICGLDIKNRISARAIILNPSMDSVLLFHCYNKDAICLGKAAKSIWITPGGGVEPDEELILSLERELNEELGLIPSDYTLKGHLWRSNPKPTIYKNKPFMFIDNYFLVRLNRSCDSFDFSKWTDEEKSVLKNLKWWYLIDLKTTSDLVVPPQLRSLDVTLLQHPIELTLITEDL